MSSNLSVIEFMSKSLKPLSDAALELPLVIAVSHYLSLLTIVCQTQSCWSTWRICRGLRRCRTWTHLQDKRHTGQRSPAALSDWVNIQIFTFHPDSLQTETFFHFVHGRRFFTVFVAYSSVLLLTLLWLCKQTNQMLLPLWNTENSFEFRIQQLQQKSVAVFSVKKGEQPV